MLLGCLTIESVMQVRAAVDCRKRDRMVRYM